MTRTRSGAPPRLLIYKSPEFWAVRSEFVFFNLLFGLLPLIGIVFGLCTVGLGAVARLRDPQDRIHDLARTSATEDRARATSVVRGSGMAAIHGVLRGAPGARVCLVIHEHWASRSWREDWRGTIADRVWIEANGEEFEVDWSSVRWEPEPALEKSAQPDQWRARAARMSSGGRVLEGCVTVGTRVAASGCADSSAGRTRLSFCEPPGAAVGQRRTPPILTTGDGTIQPRIDQRAAWFAARVPLLGAALLALMLYGWRVLRPRPLVDALAPAKSAARGFSLKLTHVVALTPLPVYGLLYAFRRPPFGPAIARVERDGYAIAAAVAALSVMIWLLGRDRRRALRAAARRLIDAGTAPLVRADGGPMELAVRVDPRAKVTPGPLSREPRALAGITATSVYRSGKNYAAMKAFDRMQPMQVPIQDGSGAAILDLTHAILDLRAVRQVARPRALRKGRFDHVLGPSGRNVGDGVYVLEERFLEPGEALYVFGKIVRTKGGGPPVIGGTEESPLLVYAGKKESLLLGWAIEKLYLDALAAASIAIAAGTAGLVAYLVSR